jgi:hypothetical protein
VSVLLLSLLRMQHSNKLVATLAILSTAFAGAACSGISSNPDSGSTGDNVSSGSGSSGSKDTSGSGSAGDGSGGAGGGDTGSSGSSGDGGSGSTGNAGSTGSGSTGSGSTGSGGGVTPAIRGECVAGSGTDYQVGDGQPYASLDDVPWNTLGPGDTVRLHYRSEPFHSKVLISTRGADGSPIKVCGILGPNGELPIIDGANATTSSHQHWIPWVDLQDLGIIIIATDGDEIYDFRPGYIEIDNLELRGAKPGNHYTTNSGEVREFTDRGTGLYIVNGDHVTVRGNMIHDNSYGMFALSKGVSEGGGEAHLTREVLIEGNSIFGNGVVGSDHRHNIYTETLGVTYQFNTFGPLRPGALGSNIKDRSAGTVIRYNWVQDGARILDLVDAQEHAADAVADPRYHETYVYGNVLIAGPGAASQVVHYGGDTVGYEQNFRKGTLFFNYNTVVTNHTVEEVWETTAVNLETNDEGASMVGNVFWNQGTSTLRILRYAGHADMGANWVSAGWKTAADEFTGTLTGTSNFVVGTSPGLAEDTLQPLAGSAVIGAGTPLSGGAMTHPIEFEFIPPGTVEPRGADGASLDLGAYDSN